MKPEPWAQSQHAGAGGGHGGREDICEETEGGDGGVEEMGRRTRSHALDAKETSRPGQYQGHASARPNGTEHREKATELSHWQFISANISRLCQALCQALGTQKDQEAIANDQEG